MLIFLKVFPHILSVGLHSNPHPISFLPHFNSAKLVFYVITQS